MLGTLTGQFKQYKRAAILTPALTMLEVFLEILIPFITARIIDEGIGAGNMKKVYLYGGVMLAMAAVSLIIGALAGKYAAAASSGFACNLRNSMYENIQKFSFSNIDKYSTPGLVTRMTTDVTNVQNSCQMLLRIACRAPLMFLFSMIMCFIINAKLSLVFLVAIVALVCALYFIMGGTTKTFKSVFRQYDELNARIQENVSAIRVVKAFVREPYENEKFRKSADGLYRLFVKAEGRLALNNPLMMLVVDGCILALSWFGAKNIVAGSLTTGELTSMLTYVMNMMIALMMLSLVFVMITMSAASGARITEVLKETADLKNPEQPLMKVDNGSIDFKHVSFSYKNGNGEETLHDLDFHVDAGETIGIIGGTGSGKSSLVNLISRLYDVRKGEVLVGKRNVKSYDMEVLRNQVSVVLQKNVLFSGTILDNLRWGKEDATEEECAEACRQACADEFINRFPDRYNTWIERGGNNLSGGQKQRLCIARALLKNPKILILDDSTSAVDTATDSRIREAFKKKIPGTTKLIIAQRISSVQDADRIMVLDDGRLNSFDTHENLLQTNKIYQEIYETQTKGGGDFDQPSRSATDKDGEKS